MLLCPYEMSLLNLSRFAAYFSDDISLRLHACLAVMRCLDEISCLLAAEFSFQWCDLKTVEMWMLKDAGE